MILPLSGFYLEASVALPSSCFQYTYDLNGNRLASSVSVLGSGGAGWGSMVFGCSAWGT
jgi:hypothetical protein